MDGRLFSFIMWPHRYRSLRQGHLAITWVDDNYKVHTEEGWVHGDTWHAFWPKLRTCKIADLPPLNFVTDMLMHDPKKYE